MALTFVREQAEKLVELSREELRLKVELLNLDLQLQPPETLQKNLDKQWEILGQIRCLNMDKKLPIVRRLADFIAKRMGEQGFESAREYVAARNEKFAAVNREK